MKVKTQNAYISSIRALYTYLIEEEVVSKNLGLAVKLVNANDNTEIEVFSKGEINKLIQYKRSFNEKTSQFLAVRDTPILNFLLETVCKPRVVPISNKLKKLMLRYDKMDEERLYMIMILVYKHRHYRLDRADDEKHRNGIANYKEK